MRLLTILRDLPPRLGRAATGAAALALACGQPPAGGRPQTPPNAVERAAPAPAEVSPSAPAAAAPGPASAPRPAIDPSLRWLVVGGGSLPESNQVSIEQDLGLAAEVFAGAAGAVLFAGGPGSRTVQVQRADAAEAGDPVALALGDLFAPRGGRGARYRATTLAVGGEASAAAVREALEAALVGPGEGPLLLYVAGHGEIGPSPRDNFIDLWGLSRLHVHELAAIVDAAARPLQVVSTTCYSGGFAELAFAAAEPTAGAAPTARCGLFATTWDLEASGCDPNPDRRAQEGYGLHFLNALRGRDRDGAPLPAAELDLDGDGVISLLEAHTRARIAARGIGVPTTTSERWLREVAPARGRSAAVALPEEDAVIAALRDDLDLDAGEPTAAASTLAEIEATIDERKAALADAQGVEDASYRRAAAVLLGRWPVLDDPWHPDFKDMYSESRAAIAGHLEADPSYRAYLDARGEVDRLQGEIADLRGEAARYERLARAIETRALAGRLAGAGGPGWERYRELLACERSPAPGVGAAAGEPAG